MTKGKKSKCYKKNAPVINHPPCDNSEMCFEKKKCNKLADLGKDGDGKCSDSSSESYSESCTKESSSESSCSKESSSDCSEDESSSESSIPCKFSKRHHSETFESESDDRHHGNLAYLASDHPYQHSETSESSFDDLSRHHLKPSIIPSSNVIKGRKFVVTFGSKHGHQWSAYNPGQDCVIVNGKIGPVLHVYRGNSYFFEIIQNRTNHKFILTGSPIGKNCKPIDGSFEPVSKGCVFFKVCKTTPKYFYYQLTDESFAGGLVIVHDN